MSILGKYSFAGGEEFITSKFPQQLQEIEEAIQSVDAARCLTKESKEKTMSGKMLYSPSDLNKEFNKFLFPKGWSHVKEHCVYLPNYYVNGYRPDAKKVYPYRDMDFVKDKLGVEVSPLNMATKNQWLTAQYCAEHQKAALTNR
jgi:restriction endonuclease BglII